MNELKRVSVYWSVSLDCTCPHCNDIFDLIDSYYEDLPDPCENDDELNLEVICPNCEQEFIVESTHY